MLVSKTSVKKKGRCVKYSMVNKCVISSFLLILPPNKSIGHISQTNREIRFKTRQIFKSIFAVLLLGFLFFFLIQSATRKMSQLSFAKANKNNDVCDYDPLHPDIRMDIPLNVPYTFPKVLTRRGF